jgi:Arc/MetJ-type ribon-helix-helix transcriptional regulator
MKITLPLELKQFVEDRVRGGSYLSESEVVADALRRLVEGAHPLSSDRLGRASALRGRLLLSLGLLKEQLSEVEITIKTILSQIKQLRREEEAQRERIKEQHEAEGSLMRSLNKAVEAHERIREDIGALNL